MNKRGSTGARRRRGSVSLLLCLITTPLILILSTFLLGVRIQSAELDVERALSAQVQTRLSGFNKALHDEFGLMALTSKDRADTFTSILPDSLKNLKVRQAVSQPVSDPAVFKASILGYMQLRLPASLLKTIADQAGITITNGQAKTTAVPASKSAIRSTGLITSLLPDEWVDEFSSQVQSAVWTLLSKAIYEFLDEEVKEALSHYQRFVAECASSGSDGRMTDYPDIFNPAQISNFAEIISQSLTVSNNEIYQFMAVREYVLGTFWPAGQPSHAATASSAGIRLSGDHLVHRNFSGVPLKQYSGREPGEVEQILTGAKTAKSGISQVKAMLVMYRTALYLFHQLRKADGMVPYRLAAAGVSALLATVSAGTIVIDPEIIAYLLLACDALRQGFSDYGKLLKGDRLAFTEVRGNKSLSFDYVMHLRILLFLTPEKNLLARASEVIKKRHSGTHNTQITASCEYRGRTMNQKGSLLAVGARS